MYNTENAVIENCRFQGEEDGESFLKESKNITVTDCFMDLRYPLWHVSGLRLRKSEMTQNCRAAVWYCNDVKIDECTLNGIKALRECKNTTLSNTTAHSPEFGWRCKGIDIDGCKIDSQYAFFESENICANKLTFTGKYSFQYAKGLTITNSKLQTKDAFWHAKNVTVIDCELDGEYLGWYSQSLTLIRCRIKGTQPLCYCKRLKLIDCTMEDCDLAFEYSDVNADIVGEILSVKNPKRGKIIADGYGDIILKDSVYPVKARIERRKKSN